MVHSKSVVHWLTQLKYPQSLSVKLHSSLIRINSFTCWECFSRFCRLLIFFSNLNFSNNYFINTIRVSVWIQNRPDILSGLCSVPKLFAKVISRSVYFVQLVNKECKIQHYKSKNLHIQEFRHLARLVPVLKTIFHQCVISYTCSQSYSDGSVLKQSHQS